MRIFIYGLMIGCAAAFSGAHLAAQDATNIVTVENAGKYQAKVGQTVHFVFKYDGFAGEVITGLAVTIDGKAVTDPKVETVPDWDNVDVWVVRFIYNAEKAGTYKVVVTLVQGETKGRAREHTLKVVIQ